MSRSRPRWSPEAAEYVRTWYGKKYAHEIAHHIGKPVGAVKTWAARNGLKSDMYRSHQPRAHNQEFWAVLLGLWIAEVSYAEIASRYGVTENMVNTWFQRLWMRCKE